jgi:hypothetical protein
VDWYFSWKGYQIMAGISTGVSLLFAGLGTSNLTYSTSTLTTSDGSGRSATASPNPDNYGQTGFASSGSQGLSLSIDSGLFNTSAIGTYPNYTMKALIKPNYMGNFTANLTPTIKDSAGISGSTSGVIPVSITRSFRYGPAVTNYSKTVSVFSQANGIFFNNLDDHWLGIIDVIAGTNTTEYNGGKWTDNAVGGMGVYNQIKFEHISGSNSEWDVYVGDGTSISSTLVKGTYYDISNIFAALHANSSPGTTTATIRITMRNKNNTSITFTQDITLTRVY